MLFIGLYVVINAAGNVLLRLSGQDASSIALMFATCTVTIAWYNAVNARKLIHIYRSLFEEWRTFTKMSVVVVITWLPAFLLPIYFNASTYLIGFISTVSALGARGVYVKNRNWLSLWKLVALIANLFCFYIAVWHYTHDLRIALLIAGTTIGGFSGYLYLRYSSELGRAGLSPSGLLAVRFWLFWLVILAWVVRSAEFSQIGTSILWQGCLMALLKMIAPLYFSQRAVSEIGPDQTGVWIGMSPLVALAMEHFVSGDNPDYAWASATLLFLILVVFSVVPRLKAAFATFFESLTR
jgi:hypothetical protein